MMKYGKYFIGFVIILSTMWITIQCENKPKNSSAPPGTPLSIDEYTILSEYLVGVYQDFLTENLMGGIVEDSYQVKIYIENDSLYHETRRSINSHSPNYTAPDGSYEPPDIQNFLNEGRVILLKNYYSYGKPYIEVSLTDTPYNILHLNSDKVETNIDSLISELEQKVLLQKKRIADWEKGKYEFNASEYNSLYDFYFNHPKKNAKLRKIIPKELKDSDS